MTCGRDNGSGEQGCLIGAVLDGCKDFAAELPSSQKRPIKTEGFRVTLADGEMGDADAGPCVVAWQSLPRRPAPIFKCRVASAPDGGCSQE